jgi:ADP-heptose:LPS heptosyltransferase
VRRLREDAPEAVVAPPAGGGAQPVWEHLLASVGATAAKPGEPPAGTAVPNPGELLVARGGTWTEPLGVPATVAPSGRAALRAAGWDGGAPLVLIHPGAGGPGKRWPAEGFARAIAPVARERSLALLINQGPADADAADALAARLPGAPVLTGLTLTELAGALGHVAAWVGNDSGVSHLAAGVGAPALIAFRSAALAWRPWSGSARVVTVSDGAPADEDVDAVAAALRALLDARS